MRHCLVRIARGGVLVSLAAILVGCCTGVTTDPREGGLAGGVCGEATGAYSARLQSRQSQLASLSTAQRGLQARLGNQRNRAAELGRSVASARQDLDSEHRSQRLLEAQIGREREASAAARAEKAAIQAEIAALDRQFADLIADSNRQANQLGAIQEGRASAANERQLQDRMSTLAKRRAQMQGRLDRLDRR